MARRSVVAGLAGLAVGGGVGCTQEIEAIDPEGLSDPKTPLTIDVHAHVFNGSDLQTRRFFTEVIALEHEELRAFGPLIEALGEFAPSVDREVEALRAVEGIALGRRGAAASVVRQLRDERNRDARDRLKKAYDRAYGGGAPPAAPPPPPPPAAAPLAPAAVAQQVRQAAAVQELGRQIDALSEPPPGALPGPAATPPPPPPPPAAAADPGLGITIGGGLAFLMRNFQYRYVNVHDYLEEYSAGRTRKIDLMVTSMVDFDWPLGSTAGTRSSFAQQVRLAERISRLTRGWVHSNVPFCPFKQVAFWRGLTRDNPMALVQDAVLNRGHVGVKIYPPMGFRPFNNAGLPTTFWDDSPLVDALKRPALGRDLDAALKVLYTWCVANDVPVMAHSAPSNVTMIKSRQEIMQPVFWGPLASDAALAGLRVNFAHFGQTDVVFDHGQAAGGLMAYMAKDATASGRGFYADSGFFAEILSNQAGLQAQLDTLFRTVPRPGCVPLAERLMYGSDWEMVTIEGKATSDYLNRFQAVFDRLDPTGALGDRFFGVNAANHLGLRDGQATRARLAAFHGRRRPPAWMAKVDALSPVA
jgi:hypothetical protein